MTYFYIIYEIKKFRYLRLKMNLGTLISYNIFFFFDKKFFKYNINVLIYLSNKPKKISKIVSWVFFSTKV